MTGLLTAIGSVAGGLAALVAAVRAVQIHRQVTPANGTRLVERVEGIDDKLDAHIEDNKRSFSAIRIHEGIPPDPPPVESTP